MSVYKKFMSLALPEKKTQEVQSEQPMHKPGCHMVSGSHTNERCCGSPEWLPQDPSAKIAAPIFSPIEPIDFKELLQFFDDNKNAVRFHGVDNYTFFVSVDGIVRGFEIIEDIEDDYRSMAKGFLQASLVDKIYFRTSVDSGFVQLKELAVSRSAWYTFYGFELVDADGHVWLKFGTEDQCDYPCFVFNYNAKS
jgi:hypothetical protein